MQEVAHNSQFNITGLLPRVFHPFTVRMAFGLSVAGAAIQTGLMLLGNLYTEAQMVDSRFHIALMGAETFLLFFLLYLYNFSIMRRDWSVARRFAVAIGGTMAISIVLTYVTQGVALWIYDEAVGDELTYLDIIKDGIVAITVILITVVFFNITRQQQTMLENEQLQAENLQVRLTSLENQIDPHFLFNSLGTLDGLIGVDEERAHTYLHQLAACYRYIMRPQRQVTLAEELAFAESFICLMQIRYADNLQVVQKIDPGLMDAKVLPISLQMLIENAIKHNVVSSRHPLTITIESTSRGTLRVSNPRQPKDCGSEGSGVGLANLSKRHQLLLHRDIVVDSNADTFAVEIPFER